MCLLYPTSHWQVGQRVLLPNYIPGRTRHGHSDKLWARWHLYVQKGTDLHAIWHQRTELLEVILETFQLWQSWWQLCGEFNAPCEAAAGSILILKKDKPGSSIGLGRIIITKEKHRSWDFLLLWKNPEGLTCHNNSEQ